MNQRKHIRHQVTMPAVIQADGGIRHEGKTRNFCLGGVLVALPERPDLLEGLPAGAMIVLRFSVETASGRKEITLPGRVVRKEQDALGIAFEQPDTGILLSLQNHVRALLQTGTGGPRPLSSDPQRDRKALSGLATTVQAFCTEAMDRFFPAALTTLRENAERVSSNEAQHPYFEAIELLKRNGPALAAAFARGATARLEDHRKGLESPAGQSPPAAEARLSLVDKEAFEDWLTLKVMASRAELHFHEEILHLQLRLDRLLGISLNSRRNPLAPSVLCNAFGEALRRLPLKEHTDRVIQGVFEQQVVEQFGELYLRLNQELARAGILPDLDVARYISEQYGQSNTEQQAESPAAETSALVEKTHAGDNVHHISEAAGAQAPGEHEAPEAGGTPLRSDRAMQSFAREQHIARNAYSAVKKLMAARTDNQGSSTASGTAARIVDAPRVDGMLAELQSIPENTEEPLVDKVRATVQREAGEDAQLPDDARNAVDVIHHLFEGITNNPALSPKVRESIRRLEVPFLRLLLQEDAFLHEEAHPARQLLNHMAQLGLRGSHNLDTNEQRIARTVEHVIDHYQGDLEVFSHSAGELEQVATRQRRLYERNVQRVSEACEGEQKLETARQVVRRELEQRLGGRPIPRAIISLVDAGWRDLLVQTLLRGGSGSREWLHFMGVIDRLLDAVEQPPEREELSGLLALIKGGISRVDESRLQDQRLIEELKSLLSRRSREKASPAMIDLPPGLLAGESPSEEGASESAKDNETQEDSRWIRRAKRYQVGDWFSHKEAEQTVMVRIAWIAEDMQRFVFVNHQGMKLLEYTLGRFSAHLENGTMVHTDNQDAPAVDRGLETMVQGIYNQMAHQATHDNLTGLVNRSEFERQLRRKLTEDETEGSLLHVDIDRFELVNNIGGHPAGDQMIRAMAERIQDTFPGSLVGRLAGDEFSVWVQPVNPDMLQRDVEKFCRAVAAERFVFSGKPFSVTLSCGISHRNGLAESAVELMRTAESACHAAKEAGRNRIQVHSPDNRDTARRNDVMAWVTSLNKALDENRLVLRCQKIEQTTPGNEPASYEVLISVVSEDGEMLAPQEFMQAAERYNRMHAVDRWVVESVLDWMLRNPEVVTRTNHIAVNLSGHSLNDAGLLEFLFDAFRRYPVPRKHLCFEITETATIASLEDAIDFIEELRNLGCRFSLDDFGSGLASYGHLKDLPVDYIKIDGSFIRNISEGTPDLALVRSINELGHLMGKKTIAEHVEDDAVRTHLKEIGVDYVQGFGVEKPRTLESLSERMH